MKNPTTRWGPNSLKCSFFWSVVCLTFSCCIKRNVRKPRCFTDSQLPNRLGWSARSQHILGGKRHVWGSVRACTLTGFYTVVSLQVCWRHFIGHMHNCMVNFDLCLVVKDTNVGETGVKPRKPVCSAPNMSDSRGSSFWISSWRSALANLLLPFVSTSNRSYLRETEKMVSVYVTFVMRL